MLDRKVTRSQGNVVDQKLLLRPGLSRYDVGDKDGRLNAGEEHGRSKRHVEHVGFETLRVMYQHFVVAAVLHHLAVAGWHFRMSAAISGIQKSHAIHMPPAEVQSHRKRGGRHHHQQGEPQGPYDAQSFHR